MWQRVTHSQCHRTKIHRFFYFKYHGAPIYSVPRFFIQIGRHSKKISIKKKKAVHPPKKTDLVCYLRSPSIGVEGRGWHLEERGREFLVLATFRIKLKRAYRKRGKNPMTEATNIDVEKTFSNVFKCFWDV